MNRCGDLPCAPLWCVCVQSCTKISIRLQPLRRLLSTTKRTSSDKVITKTISAAPITTTPYPARVLKTIRVVLNFFSATFLSLAILRILFENPKVTDVVVRIKIT